MSDTFVHSVSLMGTVVTIQVIGHGDTTAQREERAAGVERAVAWIRVIEACCSRFDAKSELRLLCTRVGEPVPVSEPLFHAVHFAITLAAESRGAFDPTVGHAMAARGFNRHFRTGEASAGAAPGDRASFRDVHADTAARTITLRQPLLLDLGAVAKGLAVDIAARELGPFHDFAIDAGGDLYLGGHNAAGKSWTVGIRHPRNTAEVVESVTVSNAAVCTSGDYESKGQDGDHHIFDPRSGRSPSALASVTVIAPSAMVADGLATAAFVLGPVDGIALLERHGVRGIMLTPSLERLETAA